MSRTSPEQTGARSRRVAATAAGLAFAILLIVAMAFWGGVGWAEIAAAGARLDLVSALLAFMGVAGPIWFGAVKWRLVLTRLAPDGWRAPSRGFFLHHSAIAVLVGQVTSPYLSGPLARGAATRRLDGLGFSGGAVSSVIEQAFDAGVILVFAFVGLLGLLLGLESAFVIVILGVFAGWVGCRIALSRPDWIGAIAARLQAARLTAVAAPGAALKRALEGGALSAKSGDRLYHLSLARFWAGMFVVIAAARMLTPEVDLSVLIFAYALAQIAVFAAFLPGNLGLADWSWALILVGFGWPPDQAALFALTLRALGLGASVLVLAATALWRAVAPVR